MCIRILIFWYISHGDVSQVYYDVIHGDTCRQTWEDKTCFSNLLINKRFYVVLLSFL